MTSETSRGYKWEYKQRYTPTLVKPNPIFYKPTPLSSQEYDQEAMLEK